MTQFYRKQQFPAASCARTAMIRASSRTFVASVFHHVCEKFGKTRRTDIEHFETASNRQEKYQLKGRVPRQKLEFSFSSTNVALVA